MSQMGSSLIQVMVASSLMIFIALGVSSMIQNQNKEVKAISEKLLTKEIESQMKALFENSDYCDCAFRNKNFDMTATPPSIVSSDQFTSLRAGYTTGPLDSPPCTASVQDFIPAVNSALPGSTVVVSSISLGGMTQVSPGVFKANMQVGFGNTVRSLKPISTSVQFNVNLTSGSATARPFNGCNRSINNDFLAKGSIVCIGGIVWDHHDAGSVNCAAPQAGYYRGVDNYRGGMAVSPRYFANKGDTLQVQGYWIGGHHGCYERFNINGVSVDNGWGDNGCHGSLSNYWIIYSYDQ